MWRRRVAAVLLAMVLVVAAGGAAAVTYLAQLSDAFDSQTVRIPQAFPEASLRPAAAEPRPDSRSPINILLLGTDTVAADGDPLVAGSQGSRTDAMMLLHLPADRQQLHVMSVMRDLWTNIPGYGEAKINAAYAHGGAPLTVRVVEEMFGARIDHVAVMDFEGFGSLTESLGGVEITVDQAFDSSHLPGRRFNAGPQLMNGQEALAFVRERYAYSDGDYQRVRNQQEFIRAALAKFLTMETLTNPGRISDVVSKTAPYVAVDEGLTAAGVAGLALELRDLRADDIKMFTLPTSGIGTSDDGQSIVLRNEAAIAAVGRALRGDTLDQYLQALPAGG